MLAAAVLLAVAAMIMTTIAQVRALALGAVQVQPAAAAVRSLRLLSSKIRSRRLPSLLHMVHPPLLALLGPGLDEACLSVWRPTILSTTHDEVAALLAELAGPAEGGCCRRQWVDHSLSNSRCGQLTRRRLLSTELWQPLKHRWQTSAATPLQLQHGVHRCRRRLWMPPAPPLQAHFGRWHPQRCGRLRLGRLSHGRRGRGCSSQGGWWRR